MTGVDALRGAGARGQVVSVARLVLVGLWVVWAAAAWWTAPRAASLEQARADASAGRVLAYQWGDSFNVGDGSSLWFARLHFGSSGQANQVVIWRTSFGQVHYAQTPALTPDPSLTAPPRPSDELARLLPAGGGSNPTPYFPPVLATIIALIALAILIQGPAPKLGTRWFWFFLGGLPFGLGLLMWLRAERPWTEPEPPAPDRKTGQPKRYSGLTGLGLMILAGIVISILIALLRSLPEWLVPSALP